MHSCIKYRNKYVSAYSRNNHHHLCIHALNMIIACINYHSPPVMPVSGCFPRRRQRVPRLHGLPAPLDRRPPPRGGPQRHGRDLCHLPSRGRLQPGRGHRSGIK